MCLVMMMMMVTQHIPTRHISTRCHICNSFTYYQSIIFPNTIITLLSLSPDFWRDCLILAQCLETIWTKVKVDLDGEMEGEGEADNAEGEEELNLFCDDLEEEWLEEEH